MCYVSTCFFATQRFTPVNFSSQSNVIPSSLTLVSEQRLTEDSPISIEISALYGRPYHVEFFSSFSNAIRHESSPASSVQLLLVRSISLSSPNISNQQVPIYRLNLF